MDYFIAGMVVGAFGMLAIIGVLAWIGTQVKYSDEQPKKYR